MQPCSQPRYGLIERSKEISGESLWAMILRVLSMVTVVLNGGNSSELCQPSSNAILANGSKRPDAFDCAPRPRRRAPSTATSASAGALGAIAAGRACRTRACWRGFSPIRAAGPDGCKVLRLAESGAIARLYTVLGTKQEHSHQGASRKACRRPYWPQFGLQLAPERGDMG